MKTILLAGGMGTIGLQLANFFKQKKFKVLAIGNCNNFRVFKKNNVIFDELINANVTFESLSIFKDKVDIIINCTGSGSVGFSDSNPIISFKKGTESTYQILEYVRKYQKDAINIFLSSGAVYGNSENTYEDENSNINPISTYAMHKLINENIYKSFSKMYGIKVFILRLFSIYGRGFRKQILWDACNKINGSKKNKIEFWGTGKEERDYLNINDLNILIKKFIDNEENLLKKSHYATFNCGSGSSTPIEDILRQIKLSLEYDGQINFNNIIRKGDPKFLKANTNKLSLINWSPEINIKDGIIDYCHWYKEIV